MYPGSPMNILRELKRRHTLQEEFLGSAKAINRIVPLVSVTTATFRHQPYIKDCIEGVLGQVTSFPIEFIIGEDGSTDGTREICKKYAEAHRDKIRLFLRDRATSQLYDESGNLIKRLNSAFNAISARGKYIALCEGDDYWTDPLKLQKQVEFLEENPGYALCVGGYRVINVYTQMTEHVMTVPLPMDKERIGYSFTLDDTRRYWLTKTLTAVFRNDKRVLERQYQYEFGRDISLFYEILKTGKGFYFAEEFGVYRIHRGGVNSMHQGKVNTNIAYKVYKELFFENKDEWTREQYFFHSLALFSFNLHDRTSAVSLFNNLKVFFEAVRLLRKTKELRFLFTAFFSKEWKSKVRIRIRTIRQRFRG